MNWGIGDEFRHIQNAARRRDASEQAMEQERLIAMLAFLLAFFGPAVFETFVAGIGAGIWALVLMLVIMLVRFALDIVLGLFKVGYGFIVHAALTLVPIGVFFTQPMLFGAGGETGLDWAQVLLAALGFPAIVFGALYVRNEVQPLNDYMSHMQRRG